jgi:hypothetical protein
MAYDAEGNYIDDSADTFGDVAISNDTGENWWNSWSGGMADSEEITLSDGSTVSVSDIYADPSRAKDIIKTSADANIFVSSVKKLFGEGAANVVKKAIYNKDETTFNPAGIATGIAGIYGLMGGNQVQTGGYNKPIPKLTATREQIPYAADPNRRPGEAGRSYFTDTQFTAPADAAAAQAAAKVQAQGIASAVPQRAAQVNPYEGQYKPAWNSPAPTAQAQTAPASGVAQLLPVPRARGFRDYEETPVQQPLETDPQPPFTPTSGLATLAQEPSQQPPPQAPQPFRDPELARRYFDQAPMHHYVPGTSLARIKELEENDYQNWLSRQSINNPPNMPLPYDPTTGKGDYPYFPAGLNADGAVTGGNLGMQQPQATPPPPTPTSGLATLAHGGLAAGGFVVPADVVAHLGNGSSSAGLALLAKKLNAKAIKGKGDGMSDSIPTHIDGKEKALVANDEAYIDPNMVKRIGGGNTKSGADKLLAMMERIRKARTGNPKQGKRINPEKFMPGGIAQLAGGGEIQRFNVGAGGATPTVTPGPLSTPAATPLGTSTSSSLSPWAGDYVTNYLGKGQALAEAPYQSYGGPLTAGASNLQNQAFAGIGAAAQEGYKPTTYQGGTFDATQAQNYMNPYLSASLNPQLDEMRRQADITRTNDAGRMTRAGAYGGSRQGVLEAAGNEAMARQQNQAIGTGYQTAYDKAMQQFNTEQDRRLGAEKSTEASRQYSADYGLKSLGEAASLGAVQRGIATEGINADRQQFEEQRDYPLKMVQYQKDLLQGLPITSAATTANTSGMSQITGGIADLMSLYKTLAGLGQPK